MITGGSVEQQNPEIGERGGPRAPDTALRALTERVKQSNEQLAAFAVAVSHDLQEPLRKVQAFADRLQRRSEGELCAESRADLERLRKAVAQMHERLEDLLLHVRMSASPRLVANTDVRRLAVEAAQSHAALTSSLGGSVTIGRLPTADVDGGQMRYVFAELIANSLEFRRPDEPPVVRITGGIEPSADGEYCWVSVTDNGIGFEAKHAERIFGLFEVLSSEPGARRTGMGLATCRRVIEQHGGTLTATGVPGQGACISARFPRKACGG